MYDATLLKKAMIAQGLNAYRLSQIAGVDPKTAQRVVDTGTGYPESIYRIAYALGFAVQKIVHGKSFRYDLAVVVKGSTIDIPSPRTLEAERELVGAAKIRAGKRKSA